MYNAFINCSAILLYRFNWTSLHYGKFSPSNVIKSFVFQFVKRASTLFLLIKLLI